MTAPRSEPNRRPERTGRSRTRSGTRLNEASAPTDTCSPAAYGDHEDLVYPRIQFRLTPDLDRLNLLAKERRRPEMGRMMAGQGRSGPNREMFLTIRRYLERWIERVLPGILPHSEMAIVRAVQARTLPWDHYAAQITNDQMLYGLREHYPDGPYVLDDNRVPVWTGTGLSRETFFKARPSAFRKGLITIFEINRVGRRPTHAYMLGNAQSLLAIAEFHFPLCSYADDGLANLRELFAQRCDPRAGNTHRGSPLLDPAVMTAWLRHAG